MNVAANIIGVRNLHVDYASGNAVFRRKKIRAVHDVSFDLQEGQALALVGESGSGKSTCAKALSRLVHITRGSITWQGQDIFTRTKGFSRKEYATRVQMIFQDPFGSLNPVHTIKSHLARPLQIHHPGGDAAIEQKIFHLLERVGLTPAHEFADKFPHEMSGGQRQRVAIARVLAVGAKVILADEPVSMLDVSIRLGILNLMNDMKSQEGIAFLYITHDIATASYFAERIAVMYVGHMVEWGDSNSICCTPQHPYTRLLIDSIPDPQKKGIRGRYPKSEIPQWSPQSVGCPFVARCPQVMPVCHQTMPDISEVRPGQYVRCHAFTTS